MNRLRTSSGQGFQASKGGEHPRVVLGRPESWHPREYSATPLTPLGHIPSTAGTFRKKFRKNSGKTPETLSERFLEFPLRVRLGCPKPYNSRHLRLPERFQNSLPPQYGWGRFFFQKWFRRGPLRAGHGIPSSTGGISDPLPLINLATLQAPPSPTPGPNNLPLSPQCITSPCHVPETPPQLLPPPNRRRKLRYHKNLSRVSFDLFDATKNLEISIFKKT